jgi:hypothetical protein
MADVDEHEASKTWIGERLESLGAESGISIDDIVFLDLGLLSQAEMLHIWSHQHEWHQTLEISAETLDDLHKDSGEQQQMNARLRDLITRIHPAGNGNDGE